MMVREKEGAKNLYFTFGYVDPVTKKSKTKWVNTGIPASKKTKKAQSDAFAKGLKLKEEFLADLKREHEGRTVIHRSHKSHAGDTIAEYAEYWLSELKGTVQDSTLSSYEQPLRKHILPRIGDITLGNLDQYDLKEFINLEIADCDERQKKIDEMEKEADGQEINASTSIRPYYASIRKHLKIIHMMLAYAISEGDIEVNAVDKINPQVLKKIPKNEYEIRPYTKEELVILRNAVKGDHLEAPIMIASYIGVRREEVLGLRWQDIDFENRCIHIRHVCRMVGSKIEYTDQMKSKSSRRIAAMIDPLREYLLELKKRQEEDKKLFGSGYQDTDIVCRWNDGQPIKPNNLSVGFSRLIKKAGLRHTRFHDLRHSVATIIIEETGDLTLASAALGHTDTKITADVYINHNERAIAKGFEALDTSDIE